MKKEELIKVVARYINNNWNASLGYGDDEKVIIKACDDLDWLLNAAGITTKDIIESCKEQ